MSSNLSLEAKLKYGEYLDAKTIDDRIQKLQEFLSLVPKHKATEKIVAEALEGYCKEYEEKYLKTGRLTFKQKVVLATNACIRHSYTDYDDILIEKTIEQTDPFSDDALTGTVEDMTDYVSEFIRLHRE